MALYRYFPLSLLLLALAAADPALAQQKNGAPAAPKPADKPQAQQPAPPPGPVVPDAYKLNMMLRSSIIALNQANKTGNYTVLQDLAAPAFRASNDSARLSQIFAELRQRNLDLSPILFFTPKLVLEPQINPNGILRLVGYFPTAPEQVNFDLYFQQVAGEWRIFGIGVVMSKLEKPIAEAAPAQQPQPQAPAAQKPAPAAKQAARPAPEAKKSAAKSEPAASARKAAASNQAPATAQPPSKNADAGPTTASVQDATTNNAVRIDLSGANAEPADNADAQPAAQRSFWSDLNPFGGN